MQKTLENLSHFFYTTFTKGATWFALWFVGLKELFAKYLFDDWDFVVFLVLIIALDTIFGIWKSVKQKGWKSISSEKMERLLVKVLLYFGVLCVSHMLGSFTIHGQVNNYFTWVDSALYGYMMAREAYSVLENISAIDENTVSRSFMDRLKSFWTSGDPADLKKKNGEEN